MGNTPKTEARTGPGTFFRSGRVFAWYSGRASEGIPVSRSSGTRKNRHVPEVDRPDTSHKSPVVAGTGDYQRMHQAVGKYRHPLQSRFLLRIGFVRTR
jgi:hypothetical protein